MAAAAKISDKKAFQNLVPFNALSPVHFNEVAQKTVVETIGAGRQVFKEGDRDNQSVYLLEGEISLLSGNEIVGTVIAGSDASRHPIAQQQPRQVSARAKSNVVVARVDSSLLDIMLTWDQSSGYEVSEISDDENDDWMTRILQSQAFLKLPASNIQSLLMRVESVPVQTGEVVLKQGGEGDYFYIIKNGRCMVTRRPSANAKEVKLAELADGDAFGEDALVSDAKRNATVTMMTDGVLMRLAKKDFVELLKEPLLNKLDYTRAAQLVASGAQWVDVRLPGEFENVHIQGSRNIPLSALRLDANGLNADTKYVVCCETGRRSASAAFVLSQRGFDVYVLDEGFSGVPAEAMAGAATSAATGVAPALSIVENEAVAVTELISKVTPVAMSGDTSAELHNELESLQREKQTLESAQTQLTSRVGALQEELERVRDASREEVLELEQSLAETRQEGATARNELQALKELLGSQRQADADLRSQAELLECELTERRERETLLQDELARLRLRVSELDTACAADADWRSAAQTEQVQFQARLDTLQEQADLATAHLERIQVLEAALVAAEQTGSHSEAQQTQRIQELENALQRASESLQQQQLLAQQQHNAGQAEYAQALETARALTQQLDDLQAQLAGLEAARETAAAQLLAQELQQVEARARADAELQAQLEAIAQASAAADEAHTQREHAQLRIDELTAALATAQDEQAQAIVTAQAETARLRDELTATADAQAALATERDALQSSQVAAFETQQALTAALDLAQARAHDLEADASTQVTQLEARLSMVQEQFQSYERERENLLREQAQLQQEQAELNARLEQAQAQVQSLSANSDEQIQRLEAALEAAQHELQQKQDEQAAFILAQNLHAEELGAAQTLLDETQAALALAQSAAANLQVEHEQAQQQAAELKVSLHNAEQTGTQAEIDLRATIESLRAELDAVSAAQTEQQTQSEQRLHEVEQHLIAARAEAEQQLREADVARGENAAQLTDQAQALDAAKHELEVLQQLQQQTVAEAQASIRVELEAVLKDVRSELDSARTALARGMQQRENLEQGLEAEFIAVKAELTSALQRAEAALKERQEQLTEAEAGYQALHEQHAELRANTDQRQQAWQAELEQLRTAATADIEATHAQMQRLKDDLAAARRLNAGASRDDELQRLQILLDQAREEADLARVEAEQSLEQAVASAAVMAAASAEEVAVLKVQQEVLQQRELEAVQQRERVEQELMMLHGQLQARTESVQVAVEPSPVTVQLAQPPDHVDSPRRSGLWLGMAAGLVLGALVAAAVSWFGKPANLPAPLTQAVPATAVAAVKPTVQPKPVPQPAPKVTVPALQVPVITKGREFRDSMSGGDRGPAMIEIAATRFSMGGSASSIDFNERPQHDVDLSAYSIGKYEVTFAEYDAFARANGHALPDDEGRGRGQRPVVNVSWDDASAYVRWLSVQTGKSYRLPSEAEWEYAAGNLGRGMYWWGSAPDQGRANCYTCGSAWDAKTTAPVGSFAANPLGVHDTAGNVIEWVDDCYHGNYDAAPTNGSAWGNVGCSDRVVRGGGYNSPVNSLRLTKRDKQVNSMRADDLGFRVARER